jgi:hypothetical protein
VCRRGRRHNHDDNLHAGGNVVVFDVFGEAVVVGETVVDDPGSIVVVEAPGSVDDG